MVSNALGLTQPSIKPDVSAVWQENGEQTNLLQPNQPPSKISAIQLTENGPKALTFNA